MTAPTTLQLLILTLLVTGGAFAAVMGLYLNHDGPMIIAAICLGAASFYAPFISGIKL